MRVNSGAENYFAEWTHPENPRMRCGVSAGKSGVNLWWSTGPSPNDDAGRGYTWEEWFDHGTTDSGGPADLITQLDALGRRLGHASAAAPALTPRASLGPDASVSPEDQRRYLQDLQRHTLHDQPDMLNLGPAKIKQRCKRMVEIAQKLWELMHPGSRVSSGTPERAVDGSKTIISTPYLDGKGQECYRLIAVEVRWQSDAASHLWHQLSVVSTAPGESYLQLWHHNEVLQVGVMLDSEAAVDDYTDRLRSQHPKLAKDASLWGSVRFEQPLRLYHHWFGANAPSGWSERLQPPKMAKKVARKSSSAATWTNELRKLLGWSPGAGAKDNELARRSGLHWIVPIGSTTYSCWVGVRLLGGVPLERCPVVLCHGANATTIATELRDSLAVLLWYLGPRTLGYGPMVYRRRWAEIEDQVLPQAAPFGGAAALKGFEEWAHEEPDPDLAAPANSPAYVTAVARLMGRLDPGQALFRQQVVALALGEVPDPAPGPRAWQQAQAVVRYAAKRPDSDLAWPVAQGLPALDTGQRLSPGHFVNVKMDWYPGDYSLACKVALRHERNGPIADLIRRQLAITDAGGRYDGLAHFELAAEFALAGDHASAWTWLAAAGYWTRLRFGKANSVIIDAARQLATDAGWS